MPAGIFAPGFYRKDTHNHRANYSLLELLAEALPCIPPVAKKCTAGVIMSESTMEITTPPITAIAKSCNTCEPAPIAKDRGSIPASVARAVMTVGRGLL